jgi:localization factor PodJL
MAADENWSADNRPGAPRQDMPTAQTSGNAASPRPNEAQRTPRQLDDAIARLSAQLRGPEPSGGHAEKKFRFDFRTHRPPRPTPRPEPKAQAFEGALAELRGALDRHWAEDAPAPDLAAAAPAGETVDAQLEAIRQRLAELSAASAADADGIAPLQPGETAQRPQAPAPAPAPAPEPKEARRAFGMSVLENHLARLAGEMAVLAQRRAPADPELLSRIAELRDLVVANNAGADTERLAKQIAAIGQRLEAMFAAMPRAEVLADLARRLDAVSKRLDEIAAGPGRPIPALDHLMREVALLRREFATSSQRPDPALEAQVSALAGRVDAIGQNAGGPALARLEAQVAALAARLEQTGARPAARPERPADSPAAAPGAESLLISALKEDLLRLQAGRAAGIPKTARYTPDRSPRAADTPTQPADGRGSARQEQAAPQRPRREIEPAPEDHRPLEPGSGRPNQGSAGARKAAFIAAARRAALAAAAEAEPAPEAGRQRRFNPGGAAIHALRGTRGAAVAAGLVVAIALAATPFVLMRDGREGAMLARTESAPSLAEEKIVALEDLPVAGTERQIRNPVPAAAPQATPPPAIDLDPGGPTENRFTLLDPGTPIGPTAKDASRPAAVSPDVTAATPPAGRPSHLPPHAAARLQPAPTPPEAAGPERLRNAAAAGNPAALFEVAVRYAEGRGVPADAAEAAKWYRLAAERGLAIAQFRIASLYERGEGVPQNRVAAADWYRRAAEQGNVRAMHNLAVMLSEGVGGAPDFSDAARWFVRAADHGVRDSQYNLGVMFARGLGGPQDLVQSYKWFAIAAQQGDPDAGTRRDEVAKVLSPDQMAQAQAAVRAWRASEPPPEANVPPVAEDGWEGPSGPVSALDRQALVRLIQERLAERGFNPGPADGHPGPMTRDAVIAFQRERGVPATGEIGPELLAALDLPAL